MLGAKTNVGRAEACFGLPLIREEGAYVACQNMTSTETDEQVLGDSSGDGNDAAHTRIDVLYPSKQLGEQLHEQDYMATVFC